MIGRFRELDREATDCPSVIEARDSLDQSTADAVGAYLESGVPILDVMESVRDPFDPAEYIPGGASLQSDGEWVWRTDLAYFVRNYRVSVPHEFISRATEFGVVTAAPDNVLKQLDRILTVAGWK